MLHHNLYCPSFLMNLRLPRLLLALTSLTVATAQARLGETLAECEARYGKALNVIPGRAQDPAQMSQFFQSELTDAGGKKIPLRIRVEFDKNGHAWYIRYTGQFPADATQSFLGFNSGEGKWGSAETFNGRNFYRTNAKAPYQATQYQAGMNRVLEIYTDTCVQDQKALRLAQVKAVQANAEWDPMARAGGTQPAPEGGTSNTGIKFNGL
jgi:hypothetical protein